MKKAISILMAAALCVSMLAACGKPCTALERTAVGALELDPELPRGGWRELRQFETGLVFGSSQDNQGADLCHFTSEI